MKAITESMLNEVNELHDWNEGQMYSGGGTRFSQTDTCRVCNLRRHYFSDSQNGVKGEYRFSDGETDRDLSLRQAVARGCA